MKDTTAHKILAIQEAFRNDPEYQNLLEEQEMRNAVFLKTVDGLSQEQKDAIFDYIGLLIEIHLRTLIYAVS